MNKAIAICAVFLALLTCAVAACGGTESQQTSSVYVMTNSTSANSVLIFERDSGGALTPEGSVLTQGKGSGSSINPLSSQGALAISNDNKWVLATNAGSNEISVFSASEEGLTFASKTSSLGQYPISLAVSDNMVYVLNAKSNPPNITGFSLDKDGALSSTGVVRLLSPGSYSQIGFSHDGKWLVVCGESTNLLLAYSVSSNNLSADPIFTDSSGQNPAGFAFDSSGNLFVVESTNNSISSYSISNSSITPITASLASGQKAPRWIAVSGSYAFTVNLGSHNISTFSISSDGQLTLLNATAASGTSLTDVAVSSDGKYLYVLDPGARAVDIFQIGKDGSLTAAGTVSGLISISVQGIAAS